MRIFSSFILYGLHDEVPPTLLLFVFFFILYWTTNICQLSMSMSKLSEVNQHNFLKTREEISLKAMDLKEMTRSAGIVDSIDHCLSVCPSVQVLSITWEVLSTYLHTFLSFISSKQSLFTASQICLCLWC